MVSDMRDGIPNILGRHQNVQNIIVQVGANGIVKQLTEILKLDFPALLNMLRSLKIELFISGPLPTVRREDVRFSRLMTLNRWHATVKWTSLIIIFLGPQTSF